MWQKTVESHRPQMAIQINTAQKMCDCMPINQGNNTDTHAQYLA